MTIGEFIDSTILPEKKTVPVLYLAQNDLIEQVPELAADISAPDYIEFDPTNENVDSDPRVRTTIWFGPAGTVSPLHTDPEDNILCQVFGHKYVRLYTDSPEFRAEKDGGGIAKQPYYQTTLHPGDALLIPKGMWHHVESLSKSFSVNFWWSRNPVSSPSSL